MFVFRNCCLLNYFSFDNVFLLKKDFFAHIFYRSSFTYKKKLINYPNAVTSHDEDVSIKKGETKLTLKWNDSRETKNKG